MVPSQNVFQQQFTKYDGANNPSSVKYLLRPDLSISFMAEEESGTNSFIEAVGSSRHSQQGKDDEGDTMGWLQLGIGNHLSREIRVDNSEAATTSQRRGLIELDWFSGKEFVAPIAPVCHLPDFRSPQPVTLARTTTIATTPSYFPHPRSNLQILHRPELAWEFRQLPWNLTASSSTPSYSRPFHQLYMLGALPATTDAGTSSRIRVIDTPSGPRSGLWFVLQASQIQGREPFLPQIPKSYLRIKDGRMTVQLLMKYLANKLELNDESEVEMRCRGQQLEPLLTLQFVRDNIWSSRDALTLPPDDHLMILNYARSA